MNILMPIYSCDPVGESESLVGFNWLSQISKVHKVYLITVERYKQSLSKHLNENVSVYYVNVSTFGNKEFLSGIAPAYFVFQHKALPIVKQIIKTQKIDIIHRITPVAFRFPDPFAKLGLPYLIGPVGGGLKALTSFPSVFKKEHPIYLLRHLDQARFYCDPFLIKTYDNAKRILIIGKYLYKVIPKRYHHKLQVMLEATIDTKKYKYAPHEFDGTIKILYVGRFIPLKAIHLLIKALYLIKKENSEIEFSATFVGDGGLYFEHCRHLINKLSLEKVIILTGHIKREDIIHFYHTSDIFVFPSLKDSSGNVLLEAMSCGTPVIAANRGGPSEIIEENCGTKIPVQNEEDFILQLKNSIIQLSLDQELRQKYSINGRRLIEQKYDLTAIPKKITPIYNEIIKKGII